MEKDILEQYISKNREAFDIAIPSDCVWTHIEQDLDKEGKDDLEQYIVQERDEFDVAVPDLKIWANIEAGLDALGKDNLEEFISREREAFDTAIPSSKVWENVEIGLDLSEKDNLEEFILREREAFDTAIPSLKVWSNINKDLSQRKGKRIKLWKSLSVAAAIVILLVAGGTVGSFLTQNSPQVTAMNTNTPSDKINKMIPEFVEMEQFFNKEVDNKIQQLASYQHDNSSVREDLEQLDIVMEELKRELLKAPKGTEQQILNNLIESYKTKLAILERVLERVQTNKPIKTSQNEVSI